MTDWLSNIRIVLVGTTHPGNIGAAARAMKTMGLQKLYLCTPLSFPDAQAVAMASGADDVLCDAQVCDSLAAALQGCTLVVGTSARLRRLEWQVLNPRESVRQLRYEADSSQVAVVFGRENSGLSNEELEKCHYLVNIPANPEYSSLNLGAAVQILCYEMRMLAEEEASTFSVSAGSHADVPADYVKFEGFMAHLEEVMQSVGFLSDAHPVMLRSRVRRIFNRARLNETEINILRGFCSSITRRVRRILD